MLRRMTVSSDNPPDPPANFDLLTVDDPPESIWQFVDAVAEPAEARLVTLQQIFGKARRTVEAQPFMRRLEPCIRGEVPAHQIFRARDPELDVEASYQPSGKTNVIGVHMRDDYALD